MPRGDRSKWGGKRIATRLDAKMAGRPVTKATIQDGDGLMISQVYAGGTADLGRGRAMITKIGHDRLIAITQADGSEIRILVVK